VVRLTTSRLTGTVVLAPDSQNPVIIRIEGKKGEIRIARLYPSDPGGIIRAGGDHCDKVSCVAGPVLPVNIIHRCRQVRHGSLHRYRLPGLVSEKGRPLPASLS